MEVPNASDEAAVIGAASQALIELFPSQASTVQQLRDDFFQALPDTEANKNALKTGKDIASRIKQERENDGSNSADVPYTPGDAIGDWQFTFKDGETTNQQVGFIDEALLPEWGLVDPFVLESGNQFRPNTFPQYNSPFYAQQLNEVQELGAENSTARSQEQTEIAQFWGYDRSDSFKPPGQWNQIAQEVSLNKGRTLEQNAELFAVLNTGLADAGIAAWDTKYVYEQIRPITAIREADKDNNTNTTADPNWEPLLDTPPFPDYISGHSVFGGAASAILTKFFGDTSFEIPSQELPGVSRSYGSFSQAADENADSRLFGGVHINADNVDGVLVGENVGNFVFDNFG